MKKILVLFLFSFILFHGCSSDPVSPPENSLTGNIVFKIDRENTPANVQTVTASLTRAGFTTITSSMNLLSDSTADLSLQNIAVGEWHLKIEAADSLGTVTYRGETDVTIIESFTIQVSLTLLPVTNGTGNIHIFVTWGTNSNNNWVDYTSNPIFGVIPSQGNPSFVSQARVIYDEDKYKMWYCNVYDNGVHNVWYAESNNGINWTAVSQAPVLTPGAYYWNQNAVVVGAVLKDESGYKMYFTGMESSYGVWSIGMATSQNGLSWEMLSSPILTPQVGQTNFGVTDVIKKDSLYYLYYSYRYNGVLTISVATSFDGYNWTNYSGNPVLTPTLTWENNGVTYPTVIYDDSKFKMIYQNYGETAFGEAVSTDGLNWTKVLLYPVIKRTDVHNNWCNNIAYPNFRKFGNEYRIYYTGTIYGNNLKIGMFRKFL